MPFSKGHTPPSEGSELVLDPVEVEVGVVMFEEPVEIFEEETDIPGGASEETTEVGVVELVDSLGATDGEPEVIGAGIRDPLVGTIGGVLVVDRVEVESSLTALEAELETTAVALEETGGPSEMLETGAVELIETIGGPEEIAVPKVVGEPEKALEIGRGDLKATLFEGEEIVAVMLEILVLDGPMTLEAGTVVAFAREGSTATVVVIIPKTVPEIVPSL